MNQTHVDPQVVFRLYLAIKKHFTTKSYDVVKSNARLNYNIPLEKSNYRLLVKMFSKICESRQEATSIIVANFAYGNEFMFEDIETALVNHKKWQRYRQSVSYSFRADLLKIKEVCEENNVDFKDSMCYIKDQLPIMFRMLLSNKIHIETLNIINRFENIVSMWARTLDRMWSEELRRIVKVGSFINIDEAKFLTIYNNVKQS